MAEFVRDLRYGWRTLRKNPGFLVTAVAVLALGVGANTAIFSVVESVLLRPLPYPEPGRLGVIWENSREQGWSTIGLSGPDYVDLKGSAQSFSGMILLQTGSGTLTGIGEPKQVPGLRVTTNTLSFLGVHPMYGRDFAPGEGWQNRVAIVTYAAAQRWFGDAPRAVGKTAITDGLAYTVIGVTPPNFWLPVASDVLVPWSDSDLRGMSRMEHDLVVFARLRPGVSWQQASAELNTRVGHFSSLEPRMRGWGASVVPLQEFLVQNVKAALWIVLAAVGLVLLIACTNVANLLLARMSGRRRETAVRAALGASQGALIRQFVTESVLLGLLGGAAGLLAAIWGIALLDQWLPATFRLASSNTDVVRPHLVIDGAVLGFTLLISLATGLLISLTPSLTISRTNWSDTLREGGRLTAGQRGQRVRDVLVVAEISLALMLLISAGLTIKSFWKLRQVNPGFLADHALALETELPTDSKRYRSDQAEREYFRRALENVTTLPGVKAAGITCSLPLGDSDHYETFRIEGRPLPPSGQLLPAHFRAVSEGYFAAMGIPLIQGRGLNQIDKQDRPPVVVIDQALAQRYWPAGIAGTRNPIGQKLEIGSHLFEIVGVVGSVRNNGLDKTMDPTVYVSYLQFPEPHMTLVVRSFEPPEQMIQPVKSALYAVDRDQPVFNVRPLAEVISGSESSSRFTLALLATFAALALGLAAIGIYGVVSYSVAQRTSEIGLRVALGAGTGAVLRLILARGAALAALGSALGIAEALIATRLLAAILFGVSATDFAVFAATAGFLFVVALAASYVPAHRAAHIDPLQALHYQ
jgi:putative ABC transport system permease protein